MYRLKLFLIIVFELGIVFGCGSYTFKNGFDIFSLVLILVFISMRFFYNEAYREYLQFRSSVSLRRMINKLKYKLLN